MSDDAVVAIVVAIVVAVCTTIGWLAFLWMCANESMKR